MAEIIISSEEVTKIISKWLRKRYNVDKVFRIRTQEYTSVPVLVCTVPCNGQIKEEQ